jgi:hypothetical protein
VLIPTCEQAGWDFWASWVYSTLIAYVIRLGAVVVNQICVGQTFGSNSIAVKRAVNVNSVEMRAIKKILLAKGLTVPKVAVLVGGPEFVLRQ